MPRLNYVCTASIESEEAELASATAVEVGDTLPASMTCRVCKQEHAFHPERLAPNGGLLGCLACGHPELFTQKNFPRAVGMTVVVVAAVLAPFTYYISLGVAALIDAGLYWWGPDMVVCYVCDSQHHDFPDEPHHPAFDREIDERLKFGDQAVMGKPMREGGTAGAPEPEH